MSTAETAVPETTSTPSGWSTFAAIMMMIAGVINGLWGWAALRDAEAWGDYRPIADATFMGPLEFWGWSAVIWAALMIVGSLLLFKGSEAGRIMGITLATFSAVLMIFVLPTFPLLAVAGLAIDVLIIYGLAVRWDKSA